MRRTYGLAKELIKQVAQPVRLPLALPEADSGVPAAPRRAATPHRRFDVLLATHGWWPWLLTYAAIAIVIVFAVRYVMKRRRAT